MHVPPRATGHPARPVSGPGRLLGHRSLAALAATALATPLLLAAAPPAAAASPATGSPDQTAAAKASAAKKGDQLARKLVRRTGAKGAMRHMKALQAIARHNDGNRAAGSRGHELSARYAGTLLKAAGYEVTYQDFDFVYRETLAEKMTVTSPDERDIPVKLMTYTKSTPEGGTKAAVAPVPEDEDQTSGCTAEDYASGDFDGKIALIQRGGCTFAEKQAAAAGAGAVAAIVYNNTEGELSGTLEDPSNGRIPTGGVSQKDGEALAAEAGSHEVTADVELREFQEKRSTPNVIAETPGGDEDHVAMFGAHLDSVTEGPGINDNASGSAGILETALQFAAAGGTRQPDGRTGPGTGPANKVRFALWTAEEVGLRGADHYVSGLSGAERDKISLYLNFDMIASPNYGLFVHDGDDSDGEGSGPGPEGSGQLERGIVDFIESRGEQTRGADFDGRSDYGPFIEADIPAGGSKTGAEGIKTAEEQKLWGGEADAAYDGCYHQKCDDLDNVNLKALDLNVKVIADAVGHYSQDVSDLP
ncbi:M28 family peptidase [Streptomyces winkii]|uniref:M28 family peptidase n=1 Tax=Streptomyces winkii TaxID=3051178 RepID=UPI0028D7962C|nr:M28 family peptidase [Streptomyces sp. DSM 40971]